MTKEVYSVRTFTLTLKTTDTPTGNSAARRLAMVLKYAGRVQGFKCISSIELDTKTLNEEVRLRFEERQREKLSGKETQK